MILNVVVSDVKGKKSKIRPKSFKKLPEPLKPTKYVPKSKPIPKPQAKPRILSKRPVPTPRSRLPKAVDQKVQRLIREITPYYRPGAIREFQKLWWPKMTQITEKSRALKNNVKTFKVSITDKKDPSNHFNISKLDIIRHLENLFNTKGSFNFFMTVKVKGLINLKNNDNECFRWCHVRYVRYLNPADRNPQRITKKD